jgi:hypothetical protein
VERERYLKRKSKERVGKKLERETSNEKERVREKERE